MTAPSTAVEFLGLVEKSGAVEPDQVNGFLARHAADHVGHAGQLHYLVMEYVDGASLQEIVDKAGPMDPLHAAHYVRQAAVGLQHAHERGLVHRDIKPGNVLLSREGVVKILDMGLA